MKKMFRNTLPVLMAAAFAIPKALTASADVATWDEVLEKYDAEISEYAAQLGNETDRFSLSAYRKKFYDDAYYDDYFKKCTNLSAINHCYDYYKTSIRNMSFGMSSLAILAHNGVISPSDIQAGRENLIDIVRDEDVEKTIYEYQSRWADNDFRLFREWQLTNFTDKERTDMLLENAEKAQKDGKYFLIAFKRPGADFNFHAMVGIGMLEGNYECNGEIYDKCILLYDAGGLIDPFNESKVQEPTNAATCIYVNSETRETYLPFYYEDDSTYSYFSVYDDDFINYNGKFNPSSEYSTSVSDLTYVGVVSFKTFEVNATQSDRSVWVNGTTTNSYQMNDFYFEGNIIHEKNINNSDMILTYIHNTQSLISASFVGLVDNVIKEENKFSFDTKEKTTYNVEISLEEGSYAFTPHFSYQFDGVTETDFSAEITDRGIVLSGTSGVKCFLTTKDAKRDENGNLISAEDNLIEEYIDSVGNILLSFDEDNNLRYYIGENYDTQVQKGDVNCDGIIDVRDASAILTAYTSKYPNISKILADYDENGVIDARDASAVLTLYTTRNS